MDEDFATRHPELRKAMNALTDEQRAKLADYRSEEYGRIHDLEAAQKKFHGLGASPVDHWEFVCHVFGTLPNPRHAALERRWKEQADAPWAKTVALGDR